ncbi:unannotated protein [freshwater metagenome]|uniref:Unannotated protein n=1 Tax=freshwater metagenome TaxID=449393 RepID=A0A6J7CVD1_9ZZZZ
MTRAPVPGAARTWIIGAGSVVYIRSNASVVPLNASATAIWLLCDGFRAIDDIVAEVAEFFGVDPDMVRTEVNSAVAGFTRMGLLLDTEHEPPATDALAARPTAAPVPAPPGFAVAPGMTRIGPFAGLGSAFVVDVEELALAAFIADRLEDLLLSRPAVESDHAVVVRRSDGPDGQRSWAAEIDGRGCGPGADDDGVLQELLTGLVFETVSNRPVTFHAAAVEHGGRAALLTGSWGAGKTTTMLSLLRAGFGYMADEVVVVDPATFVAQPWPSPISQTEEGWRSLGVEPSTPSGCEQYVGWHQPLAASALGFARLAGPAPLGAMVIVVHAPGEPTRLEALDPAYVVAALQPMLLVAAHAREEWCDDLVALARVVPGYRLTVDDLATVPGLIAEVLDRR